MPYNPIGVVTVPMSEASKSKDSAGNRNIRLNQESLNKSHEVQSSIIERHSQVPH